MTKDNQISVVSNSAIVNRVNENLSNIWSASSNAFQTLGEHEPFRFTGQNNAVSTYISTLITDSKEVVYISTSSLTDSAILSALEGAVSRKVRVYVLIDTNGFNAFLENDGSQGLLGRVLLRKRSVQGIDLILADWKLASKSGCLLNAPLDGTLGTQNGNWCMTLDQNQIDEIRSHSEHEFWSITEGVELLAPNSTPEPINSRPYPLKKLNNLDFVLRSVSAVDGDDSKAEAALRKEKKWTGQICGDSGQSSIILRGEAIEVGTDAAQVLHSSPKNINPASGLFAHSGLSVQLAIGDESFLGGWDRSATGDWHSLLRLNAGQAKAAKDLLQSHSKAPEWIGHTKINLGDAGDKIIRNGSEMSISDKQTENLGVVHLDQMPDSAEALETHQPTMNTPESSLARECTFKWVCAPPVVPDSASDDALHSEWAGARSILEKRLNALNELNQPSKLPGFDREAKKLKKSIAEALAQSTSISNPKLLDDLVKTVEELSKAVGGNLDAIKAAEDESARAELEKEQKEAHGVAVQESNNQVKDLTGRLKTSNAELKKLESSAKKAEGWGKERIDSDISQLRPKIKQMESDLSKAQEVSTSKFQFKAPASPVAGKKGDSQAHKFLGDTRESKLQIMIPKEALPDAGTLYLEGDNRYLAISNWEEVAPARKDAKRLNATLCATREVLG